MRLTKIKLAGFKSFVDPTSIPFPDDMTAVVGPNGCGKSNVIDAVRWVLGESSAKNLRGDAMTDVIFNGSSARKPVSQCSVELVFDNSSGRIQGEYAGYQELSVKRVVTRDAQSNYFLNASKCRRRDVTDLFLGTGLGPRSYAIIEQGMISRLIESKPQELRVFIEEAAGVSKYKERRRETENRIRHTQDNLSRLEDVRGELGQQLEKLQRQAAAAKRYKALKASERQLKGELAAIRWRKHSQHVEQLDQQMQRLQTQLEALIARQRGDERGITDYREQQQDAKQQLDQVQQAYFNLSNQITRIEQNQIHAKQRRQQIEKEQQQLREQLADLAITQAQHNEQQDALSMQLEMLEPQQEEASERYLQAQEKLQDTEQRWQAQQRSWREQDQNYHQLKQKVQRCHSQIQASMDMQMRTQQRISELQQEQQQLADAELNQQHEELAAEHQLCQEQVAVCQVNQQQAQQDVNEQQQALQQANQQLAEQQGQLTGLDARLTALQALHHAEQGDQDITDWVMQQQQQVQALSDFLNPHAGSEQALEVVCQLWSKAFVVHSKLTKALTQDLPSSVHSQFIFSDKLTSDKPQGTLAEAMQNTRVPAWFCQILLVDNNSQAFSTFTQLAQGQSVVSKSGLWLHADWALQLGEGQGSVQRAAQLKQLAVEQNRAQTNVEQASQVQQQAQAASEQAQQRLAECNQQLEQARQAQANASNQLQLVQMQQQQEQQRQQRLQQELAKQQQLLEDDQLQAEVISEQLQELEETLAEQQMQQDDLQVQHEQLQQALERERAASEQAQHSQHQLAMQLQALSSQVEHGRQLQQREGQQQQQWLQRQQQLTDELVELNQPMQDQHSQLATLLAQQQEAQNQQSQLADKVAELDKLLSDAEQGQQGLNDQIQKIRGELESHKLEYEGFRVRASSIVEQLQETQQSLKPLLEQLPEQADEKQWQQDLDKTSASISRLGAVNLAAVEEYEIQAERKAHLDEQNADLVAALDTLQTAIRKIDKETRSRFKDTFDKVNADLKALFPKVFGGGSAYLELTDDDLLETGVAIMARPPGKKNSTIHLLSGGEKALTALSLVFAIFRLNPAPFCLLDEVDAPLDDANVGRFCKLVSEMSKTVQFIYITHNKIAMEMASHLTGVTMAEPGVSRMVAVDIEEAIAIAQA